jgi:hypothetical protein
MYLFILNKSTPGIYSILKKYRKWKRNYRKFTVGFRKGHDDLSVTHLKRLTTFFQNPVLWLSHLEERLFTKFREIFQRDFAKLLVQNFTKFREINFNFESNFAFCEIEKSSFILPTDDLSIPWPFLKGSVDEEPFFCNFPYFFMKANKSPPYSCARSNIDPPNYATVSKADSDSAFGLSPHL